MIPTDNRSKKPNNERIDTETNSTDNREIYEVHIYSFLRFFIEHPKKAHQIVYKSAGDM